MHIENPAGGWLKFIVFSLVQNHTEFVDCSSD